MAKEKVDNLERLRGVGKVLAARFCEAGYDTFAKVAAATEEELQKIQGVNTRVVSAIIEQAGQLADEMRAGKAQRVEDLRRQAANLKREVHGIALRVRESFKEEIAGKAGKKLEKQITKMLASLESVEGKLETRAKKAGKSMAKVEARLAHLAGAGVTDIDKGLKKARKCLKKVYS